MASALDIAKRTFKDFSDDECAMRAAALSYYTIFSLPPLLVLILKLVGLIWNNPAEVQGLLEGQFGALMGTAAKEEVHTMIVNANKPSGGVVATVLGFVGLAFGATGAFLQLQGALNRAWEVAPDPEGGIKQTVFKRFFSFGMILAIVFLLLVLMFVSTLLSALGDTMAAMLPGGFTQAVFHVVELVVSFGVIALLFAAMFKVLPDAEITWKDVWPGALLTALLFVVGKFLIGLYLGQSNPGEAFGAAGALAVMLVWIYYSGLILLLGAEFTQTWADEKGSGIRPEKGAVRVVEKKEVVPPTGGEQPA